jgi:hypothetical protein
MRGLRTGPRALTVCTQPSTRAPGWCRPHWQDLSRRRQHAGGGHVEAPIARGASLTRSPGSPPGPYGLFVLKFNRQFSLQETGPGRGADACWLLGSIQPTGPITKAPTFFLNENCQCRLKRQTNHPALGPLGWGRPRASCQGGPTCRGGPHVPVTVATVPLRLAVLPPPTQVLGPALARYSGTRLGAHYPLLSHCPFNRQF